MTDKERAEEYVKEKISDMKVNGFTLLEIAHLSNGANIYNPKVEHLLNDKIKQAYFDGLAERRAELEIREKLIKYWKKKCKDKSNDVIELQKENAELKKDKEWLDNTNNEQTKVILKLQAQIEKIKCCGNCKKERNKPEPLAVHVSCAKCRDYSEWELAE